MNRFGFCFFAAVFIYLIVLSGCSTYQSTEAVLPTSTPQPTEIPTPIATPTEKVIQGTVIIWHSWEEMQRSALFRRITAFQAVYPDVQFDVLYIPAIDLRASFEAAMAENAGPTILIGPAEWGPALFERGWATNLSSQFSQETRDQLNPAAVGTGQYKDKLVSVPLHIKGVVLYRNKSIIPNSPGSFDSLVTLAHTANQGSTVGAILERSFYYSAGHLYGLGGSLMNAEGKPAFNADNYHASLTWLNLLKSFELAGPTEYLSDSDLKMFMEGRVGFIIESTELMYNIAGELDPLNLAIDPWPTYKDGHLAGFVQAEGAYLTPKASDEDNLVSRMFLEYLLSPESQATLAGVGFIPAIKPDVIVANQLRISDPFVSQAMAALGNGAAYPSLPVMNVYSAQMDVVLQGVLYQGEDPLSALKFANTIIQNKLISYTSSVTPTP
jgi:ABC-type glycerol-3-phosphate transport system substrate-binding protein